MISILTPIAWFSPGKAYLQPILNNFLVGVIVNAIYLHHTSIQANHQDRLFPPKLILCALLVLVILSQEKGVGLSATFGGGGEFYRSRRGIDKFLFATTVVLSILFILTSIAFIFVR